MLLLLLLLVLPSPMLLFNCILLRWIDCGCCSCEFFVEVVGKFVDLILVTDDEQVVEVEIRAQELAVASGVGPVHVDDRGVEF